jgi:hypothetical protein
MRRWHLYSCARAVNELAPDFFEREGERGAGWEPKLGAQDRERRDMLITALIPHKRRAPLVLTGPKPSASHGSKVFREMGVVLVAGGLF